MIFIKKFFFTLLIALPLFTTTTLTVKQNDTAIFVVTDEVPDYEYDLDDKTVKPHLIIPSIKVI